MKQFFPKGHRFALCGSTKYKAEFDKCNLFLTLNGGVVYSVAAFGHADKYNFTVEDKTVLDHVHKLKIDNSDSIFVVDVDNYIGESTKSEITHAQQTGKNVYYYTDYAEVIDLYMEHVYERKTQAQ